MLANCGDWHAMRSQFRQALPFFAEAEQVIREMIAADPDNITYQERLATYLEKSGDAYHDLRQNDEALELFQRTLEIRKTVYERRPQLGNRPGSHVLCVRAAGQPLDAG